MPIEEVPPVGQAFANRLRISLSDVRAIPPDATAEGVACRRRQVGTAAYLARPPECFANQLAGDDEAGAHECAVRTLVEPRCLREENRADDVPVPAPLLEVSGGERITVFTVGLNRKRQDWRPRPTKACLALTSDDRVTGEHFELRLFCGRTAPQNCTLDSLRSLAPYLLKVSSSKQPNALKRKQNEHFKQARVCKVGAPRRAQEKSRIQSNSSQWDNCKYRSLPGFPAHDCPTAWLACRAAASVDAVETNRKQQRFARVGAFHNAHSAASDF